MLLFRTLLTSFILLGFVVYPVITKEMPTESVSLCTPIHTPSTELFDEYVTKKCLLYSYLNFSNRHPVSENNQPLIVIDPGHGEFDVGADYHVYEKDLNLKVAKLLEQKLKNAGFRVQMTRNDDTYINNYVRAYMPKKINADLFISIHFNASANHRLFGTEVFYNEKPYKNEFNPYASNSKKLAFFVYEHLNHDLPTVGGGIHDQGFIVLRKNSVPSILVEVAYVDNPKDSQYFEYASFYEKAAHAIVNGVMDYFRKSDKE